jgi:glycolate oxidase iron-sulfur subunit
LCLPHCPTYGISADEAESPRGRIALMQALAENALPAAGRLEFHLDRCLSCRSCERVCPSKVEYGHLLEAGRALAAAKHPRPAHQRLPKLIASGAFVRAAPVLRFYQRSGLQYLLRRSGALKKMGLQRLDSLLPPLSRRLQLKDYYPPVGLQRGNIGLFTGCMGTALEQDALHAAIALLNRLGYGVHIPPQQTCCGAMHLQSGDADGAAALAERNIAAFNALSLDALTYCASGCGAALEEYARWFEHAENNAPTFRTAPLDLCSLLARIEWPENVKLRPLRARVLVHEPCSLRNVLRAAEAPYQLLRRIPELSIEALPGNARCCGGAGATLIQQSDLADALRADKIAALKTAINANGEAKTLLVTSNLGCALQLSAGIRAEGIDVEVIHPVTLLWRQLTN